MQWTGGVILLSILYKISQEMASPDMVVFFVAIISREKEKIPFQDARRGLATFSLLHVFLALKISSSWMYYVYSHLGITRFEAF